MPDSPLLSLTRAARAPLRDWPTAPTRSRASCHNGVPNGRAAPPRTRRVAGAGGRAQREKYRTGGHRLRCIFVCDTAAPRIHRRRARGLPKSGLDARLGHRNRRRTGATRRGDARHSRRRRRPTWSLSPWRAPPPRGARARRERTAVLGVAAPPPRRGRPTLLGVEVDVHRRARSPGPYYVQQSDQAVIGLEAPKLCRRAHPAEHGHR